jgi:hypothetical protein
MVLQAKVLFDEALYNTKFPSSRIFKNAPDPAAAVFTATNLFLSSIIKRPLSSTKAL